MSLTPSSLQDVKRELMKMMEQVGFWSSRSSSSSSLKLQAASMSKQQISVLNAVLTAGLYDNVARVLCTPSVDVLERVACTVETPQGKAQVHFSSVNRNLQTHGWLLYQEKVWMKSVCVCARVCEGLISDSHLCLKTCSYFLSAGEIHQDLPSRHHSDFSFPHAAVWRRH